jgi:membrane-bound lytic murein transglycosylase D
MVAVANKSLGFTFQVHPMIQQYVNYYRGRGRSTMETGLYRSGMFMRMARRIFREEGVPENVAWLGQVESAWKPTALSWAAASGLWQFIPGTGARSVCAARLMLTSETVLKKRRALRLVI